MMLGAKGILPPLIPNCYVLCTLVQASLHRIYDLLTLVSCNDA